MGFRPKINITDSLTGGNQTTPTTGQSMSSPSTSVFGTVANFIDKGVKTFQNAPVVKQAGQAVGAVVGGAAGAMRAGVEVAGTPLVQAKRVLSGQAPESFGETMSRVGEGAKEGYNWGSDVGFQGATTAPLGAGGKIVQGVLATGALARGADTYVQGEETGDEWKKALGMGQAGLGLLGLKGAANTKGLILNQEFAGAKAPTVGVPKAAEAMTGIAQKDFERAASAEMRPTVQKYLGADDLDQAAVDVGKQLWSSAKTAKKEAMDVYDSQKKDILLSADPAAVPEAHRVASNLVTDAVKTERVKLVPTGEGMKLDFSNSRYAQNPEAQGHFESIMKLMSDSGDDIDSVLAKQEALSDIQRGINAKTSPDLKRLVGTLKRTYEDQIDSLTGGASEELRQSYAKSIAPVRSVMDKLGVVNKQTGNVEFSANKAKAFINNALKDVETDQAGIVKAIDESAGTNFSKEVEGLNLARKMSQVEPGKAKTIGQASVREGVSKIPVAGGFLKPLFSPQAWASYYMRKGATPIQAVNGGQSAVMELIKHVLPQINAQVTGEK